MKNAFFKRLHTLAPAVTLLALVPSALAEAATQASPPGLSVDTPLADVRAYQAFFKEMANRPSLQVPSDKTAYMWQNISRILPVAIIPRDGDISPLPVAINPAIGALSFDRKAKPSDTVADHFANSAMDAMIVVQGGMILDERYKSMRPFDKHNWFSSGKVISSTLIGLLADAGKIDLGKPVSDYLTEVRGSQWDHVTVQQTLDMATGLDSTEHDEPGHDSRTNPEQGWFRWAASIGVFPDVTQRGQTPFEVLRHMKRKHPANTIFEYNSINTWVLEMIVEEVSGKPLAETFSSLVWRKIGAQADAYVAVTPDGYPMSFGFVSSTLRDFARFGMIFTPSWNRIAKEPVISDALLAHIQKGGDPAIYGKGHVGRENEAVLFDEGVKNSFQWDVVFPDGDFFKQGVGGQGLYISPSRNLVIAWFCTGYDDELVMVRAIATSGLFK